MVYEFSSLFRVFRSGYYRIVIWVVHASCIFFCLVVVAAFGFPAIFAVTVETLFSFVEVKSVQGELAFAVSAVVGGGVF